MAPGTQLVFLFLYYEYSNEPINLKHITNSLSISKATCTRAIEDLTEIGLIDQVLDGRNKWITPAYEKSEFLLKGFERLKSPVDRILYLKNHIDDEKQILSSIRALSEQTMLTANELDGAIAIYKKDIKAISPAMICDEKYFGDFGGIVIEVWSYDPAIFLKDHHVDDVSLILSLDLDPDERVQMSLDEIRARHGLPLKEELVL